MLLIPHPVDDAQRSAGRQYDAEEIRLAAIEQAALNGARAASSRIAVPAPNTTTATSSSSSVTPSPWFSLGHA